MSVSTFLLTLGVGNELLLLLFITVLIFLPFHIHKSSFNDCSNISLWDFGNIVLKTLSTKCLGWFRASSPAISHLLVAHRDLYIFLETVKPLASWEVAMSTQKLIHIFFIRVYIYLIQHALSCLLHNPFHFQILYWPRGCYFFLIILLLNKIQGGWCSCLARWDVLPLFSRDTRRRRRRHVCCSFSVVYNKPLTLSPQSYGKWWKQKRDGENHDVPLYCISPFFSVLLLLLLLIIIIMYSNRYYSTVIMSLYIIRISAFSQGLHN